MKNEVNCFVIAIISYPIGWYKQPSTIMSDSLEKNRNCSFSPTTKAKFSVKLFSIVAEKKNKTNERERASQTKNNCTLVSKNIIEAPMYTHAHAYTQPSRHRHACIRLADPLWKCIVPLLWRFRWWSKHIDNLSIYRLTQRDRHTVERRGRETEYIASVNGRRRVAAKEADFSSDRRKFFAGKAFKLLMENQESHMQNSAYCFSNQTRGWILQWNVLIETVDNPATITKYTA